MSHFRFHRRSRWIWVAATILQIGAVSAYYGFSRDPTALGTNAVEATFVPESYEVCRLTQPDGKVRHFYRDRKSPENLLAEEPWTGISAYGRTSVRTREGFSGGQTGFEFYNGTLRKMILDGKQTIVKPVRPIQSKEAIPALWSRKQSGMVETAETIDLWKDSGRLRIPYGGFVNPNKTGALFMELAVIFLAGMFACLARRRFVSFIVLGGLFLASSWLLLLTQSRGCFLGLVVGGILLLMGYARNLLSFRRIMIVAVVVAALCGGILEFGGQRFTRGFLSQDPRTNRLTMWAKVPSMIADAPGGWGFGNAGRAYVDWYQSLDLPLAVSELQNSHLTWLVEMGNVARTAYVFLWLFLLFVLSVFAVRDRRPLPVAIFSALGIAACFTHELEEPVLWILPALSLVSILCAHRMVGRRTAAVAFGVALAVAVAAVTGVNLWGRQVKTAVSVSGAPDRVFLNGQNPDIWIVGDDRVMDSGYQIYQGKEMRLFYHKHANAPSIAFTRQLSALPKRVGTLVLAGVRGAEYLEAFRRRGKVLCQPEKLVFLSPPFTWKALDGVWPDKVDVRVIVGRLAGRLSADYDTAPAWVRQIPGAELYIPDWLRLVTGEEKYGAE